MPRLIVLLIACAAALFGQSRELYRPRFHYSPQRNWTNDPNGLVWFDGEYHLFYQYNPFASIWGHMSWGHAVSRDLVHWQELPVALAEENGVMIFTGSTVVDEQNSSGFCLAGRPCLVAVYTGHTPRAANGRPLQTQNLAFSNDRGRTWTKYSGNPVLDLHLADFRDPHVFWSAADRRWTMVVALPDQHQVLFWGSTDLKHWERFGEFGPAGATGGQWECPTLTEVPVEESNPRRTRWVLKVGLNPGAPQGGSGEQYFVGRFERGRFVNDNPPSTTLWTDYGKDCYCALTFNHLPASQAPIMLGWMNNWQYADKLPTAPWRGQMTAPRRLQLRQGPQGLRLVQTPAETIASLRRNRFNWAGASLEDLNAALRRLSPRESTFELDAALPLPRQGQIGWRLLGTDGTYTTVGYDARSRELWVDRTHSGKTAFSAQFPARTAAPLETGRDELQLTLLVDNSTLEVFAQQGEIALTNLFYPPEGPLAAELFATETPAGRIVVDRWDLAPAADAAKP